jgi:uncharacterized membrane protein YtjA (UPF0391 family)
MRRGRFVLFRFLLNWRASRRLRQATVSGADSATGGGMIQSARSETTMLRWALIFLVVALIAGFFGFFHLEHTAATIAQVLFFVFLILFVIGLISGRGRTVGP